MIPWYVSSFGRDYLDLYPHRDDAEAQADVEAIINLIDPPKDEPLLDLACGAGRHLLALHNAGFRRLVGLDLSDELLQVAAERLAEAGAGGIELVNADMGHIPYAEYFTTVLSLFTSFGYFERDEENAAVLAAVRRAMVSGGWFLIDYLNCDWVIAHLVPEEEQDVAGRHLQIERRLTLDGRRVEKTTRVLEPGNREKTYHESVRLYPPSEIETMLEAEGFTNIWRFGSLEGEPHRPESPRLILVAEKGDARASKA